MRVTETNGPLLLIQRLSGDEAIPAPVDARQRLGRTKKQAGPVGPGPASPDFDYGIAMDAGAVGLTDTHPERSGPYTLPIDVPVIGTETSAVAVMWTAPL